MSLIVIAIGANLSDHSGRVPLATCRAAVESLAGLPGSRLVAVSPWYATAPIPASDQPEYVNGIVLLAGAGAPEAVLRRLHAIEARAGRVRGAANAPRVLDLDLIAIDDVVRDAPDPVLPHPRAHERAFVLMPLRDVLPTWVHPRLGRTVAALLADLGAQGIRGL